MLEQRLIVDVATDRAVELGTTAVTGEALARVIPKAAKFVRDVTGALDAHVSYWLMN
jgi:hypothetical protein